MRPAGWWQYLIGGLAAAAVAMIITALMNADDSSQLGFLGGSFGKFVFALGIAVVGVLAVLAASGRVTPGYPAIGAVLVAVPSISFLVTVQAARTIIFGGLALLGVSLLWGAARRVRPAVGASLAISVVIVVLAFFIQSEAGADGSRKIRVELFTVLLLVALVLAASAVARYLSSARTSAPPPPSSADGCTCAAPSELWPRLFSSSWKWSMATGSSMHCSSGLPRAASPPSPCTPSSPRHTRSSRATREWGGPWCRWASGPSCSASSPGCCS